jgi:hypothetical protein
MVLKKKKSCSFRRGFASLHIFESLLGIVHKLVLDTGHEDDIKLALPIFTSSSANPPLSDQSGSKPSKGSDNAGTGDNGSGLEIKSDGRGRSIRPATTVVDRIFQLMKKAMG